MTEDLVKRLRDNCSCNFPDTPCGAEEQCRNDFEAADRIELLEDELLHCFHRINELQTALRMVIDWDNTLDWEDGPAWGDLMDIARKALEGKDG